MQRKLTLWTKIVIIGWIATIFFLFLYSFTQIDLGLTLTRLTAWQVFQKNFQYIGYFQRPLSMNLYLGILFLLFIFYLLILSQVKRGKLDLKKIWLMVFITSGILWLSYNAFSYDLFNYIFYGKIITFYHQNPYKFTALDFPGDPMLGFMHWTHNYYPYGPLWLAITLPLSVLGFNKFLLTLILFKGLAAASYLAIVKSIEKILERVNPQAKLLGMAVFAFSPLVVIEGLVSAHNDIVMFAAAMIALLFLLEKKYVRAWLLLLLSIGMKYATGMLLPFFVIVTFFPKVKLNWNKSFLIILALMFIPFYLVTKRSELQPWYLLYFWPYAGLVPFKKWLFYPLLIFSLGMLLHYAPFLYTGSWTPWVILLKFILIILSVTLAMLVGVILRIKEIKFPS